MSHPWQFQPGTDAFGNRYLPVTVTGQVFTGRARPAAGAVPALLAPGEYVIPAGSLWPGASITLSTSTVTSQAALAVRYIADAYGNRDEAISARGITWRVRPLTLEEMLA